MEEGNLQQKENKLPTRKILIFTLSYFVVLAFLIALTLIFDIRLYSGEGFFRFPSPWLLFLWAIYYIAPFVVAIIFGFRARPFWRNFILLAISIFALHFLYSVVVSIPRVLYAQQWQKDIQQSQARTFKVNSFEHQFSDDNKDGLTDKIILSGALDVSSLTNGKYILYANLSKDGQPIPGGGLGTSDFSVTNSKDLYSPTFEINPINFKDFTGNLDVNLELRRDVSPSEYGKALIFLCRWAAFFCPTSKEGYDPVIYHDLFPVQEIKSAHTFSLSTGTIQRDQVTFVKFLNDFGRDTNGNGMFDELVIQVELDSIYNGPIYFSAQVDGSSNFFSQTTSIKKGVTTVDFVMDGKELKKVGFNGPYKLSNFYLLNNDPYCPGGKCIIKNHPPFTVYLERYTTKSYRVEQFE